MAYVPERGHVIWLRFDPRAGREQKGIRPAFVLSPLSYNSKTGLCVLCPITKQVKGYPFEVMIPEGYKISGVILSDQIKNLDWRVREAGFCCVLPENIYEEVLAKINTLLH